MAMTAMDGTGMSQFALGAMKFGGVVDRVTAEALYRDARMRGINHFDSAHDGGDSGAELALARLIKDERDRVVVATKPDPWRSLGRADLTASIAESLKRLSSDYIDLFYLTAWRDEAAFCTALDVLAEFAARGVIRGIGLANVVPAYVLDGLTIAARTGHTISAVQTVYNVLRREIEPELLPYCRAHGVAIMTYSPLAGGLLSGRFASGGKVRANDGLLHPNRHAPEWIHQTSSKLRKLARDIGLDPVTLAVTWAGRHQGAVMPILSARGTEQLAHCLDALDLHLAPDVWHQLDHIAGAAQVEPRAMAS
ncbi:MAG: aldo/keto reductase [Deltaproteobacteria bacterium]